MGFVGTKELTAEVVFLLEIYEASTTELPAISIVHSLYFLQLLGALGSH